MADIVSRPYRVDERHSCECCVFGTGAHEPWCLHDGWRPVLDDGRKAYRPNSAWYPAYCDGHGPTKKEE